MSKITKISKDNNEQDGAIKSLVLPSYPVVSVDQSLDSTGIIISIPAVSPMTIPSNILEIFGAIDPCWREALSANGGSRGILNKFHDYIESNQKFVLTHKERGKRKDRAISFNVGSTLVASLVIKIPPTHEPEWKQSRTIARLVGEVASSISFALGTKVVVATEMVALGGMAGTVRILPILGMLHGILHEELAGNPNLLAIAVNSTFWKKAVTGKGNCPKKEAGIILKEAGAPELGSDDELDALAIAVSLGVKIKKPLGGITEKEFAVKGIAVGGRIRPLPGKGG